MRRSFAVIIEDDGTHRFRMRTTEGENRLLCSVNHEGITVDVTDDDGEVIGTCYMFWDDLEEMARENG